MEETASVPPVAATADAALDESVVTRPDTDSEDPRPALERIEAALERLQAASARRFAKEKNLAARHHALRASVSETLGELDTLIARTAP